MNRLLFISVILLFTGLSAQSQDGFLFVKKGYKKKKTYHEGDRVLLQADDERIIGGIITMLRNDTIWINGLPLPRRNVTAVFPSHKSKKAFRISAKELLLVTGGVALTTAGLAISKQATFREALTTGAVMGYGQLGIQYLMSKISFRRKKFRIGKKFQLQVLDFHIPRRGF
jgi:hypothetical protein